MIVESKDVIYKFENKMDYKYRIETGRLFQVETNDCFFQQVQKEEHRLTKIDHERLNPATGPIYIEGAEPGDILVVDILDIEIAEKGVAAVIPGGGVLGDRVEKPLVKVLEIEEGLAKFKDLKIGVRPMIGVIGVAPSKEDGDWNTDSPWKHGGNMDTKDIVKGTRLYFRVNVEGGLLALGDCHGLMGDGEVCFTGLEIPALVSLKTSLIKGCQLNWPLLETEDASMILVSGHDLDDAVYKASLEASKYLMNALDLCFEEAYILTSLVVDLKISQLVDPKITVRASIPKTIVSTEKLIKSYK